MNESQTDNSEDLLANAQHPQSADAVTVTERVNANRLDTSSFPLKAEDEVGADDEDDADQDSGDHCPFCGTFCSSTAHLRGEEDRRCAHYQCTNYDGEVWDSHEADLIMQFSHVWDSLRLTAETSEEKEEFFREVVALASCPATVQGLDEAFFEDDVTLFQAFSLLCGAVEGKGWTGPEVMCAGHGVNLYLEFEEVGARKVQAYYDLSLRY